MRRTALETGVAAALEALGRPCAGQTVVVGLSGGADSVALLDVMASLGARRGFAVVAAHLDHALRPGSEMDAEFCRGLARRLGVAFRSARADVRARARADKGGIEDAARRERHAFLARVRQEEGAGAVVLAHTRDDQAETVLLRLVRGAGGAGLAGMRGEAGGVLRPMLELSRRDVLDHLSARGLDWREDPTNADLALLRNRVRHELIPYLERHFNPAVREALARSAALAAADAEALEAAAAGAAAPQAGEEGTAVLPLSVLRGPSRAMARLAVRRALRQAGGLAGVGLRHVDAVLDLARTAAPSGRRVDLPGSRQAVFHFDQVRFGPRPAEAAPFALPLTVPGEVALPDGRRLLARSARGPASARGGAAVVAVPDAPLLVRTRRPGDRVRDGGRDQSLRRFLMDRRVPARERACLPLLAAGERVLWVPGQGLEGAAEGARFVRLELRAGAARRAR